MYCKPILKLTECCLHCGFDRGCNDIVRNLFRILINDLKKKMNFGV
jgi:hypothetical protein